MRQNLYTVIALVGECVVSGRNPPPAWIEPANDWCVATQVSEWGKAGTLGLWPVNRRQ